jgi:sRNA-binding protein
VTRLIAERGYPTGDYEEHLANLSVEHARTIGHYRDAHEISQLADRGEATTEQLRQAVVHYRALFSDLLGVDATPGVPAGREAGHREAEHAAEHRAEPGDDAVREVPKQRDADDVPHDTSSRS